MQIVKTIVKKIVVFWQKYVTESYDYMPDWLSHAKEVGASHLVTVWDSFEMEEFPVFIMSGDTPERIRRVYDHVSTTRVSRIIAV